MGEKRLTDSFFINDVLLVANSLIGKLIVRDFGQGNLQYFRITETEAYNGEADLACHASKGRTKRTEVMYHKGGKIYVYLIYGMYWMLNFVTSSDSFPAAVLIRSVDGFIGPGRVGRGLMIDGSFYGENLSTSKRIWVEDDEQRFTVKTSTRIGVDYAGKWAEKPWRFILV